jgi:hypothetical protein
LASSSSPSISSSNPLCNLLANTMFDTIYYIPMIYCTLMPCVDSLLVNCNGDIVCSDGCINVCYLL